MNNISYWNKFYIGVGQLGQLAPFWKYPSIQAKHIVEEKQVLQPILQVMRSPGKPKVPTGHNEQMPI